MRQYPDGPYQIRHRQSGRYSTLRLPLCWQYEPVGTTEEAIKKFLKLYADEKWVKMIRPRWHHVEKWFGNWEVVAGDQVQEEFIQKVFS